MTRHWVNGYVKRAAGPVPHTFSAQYSLKALANRELLNHTAVRRLLFNADLQDFSWYMLWSDDAETPDAALPERLADVEGYVLFIHGWTGSRAIWEDLPGQVLQRNRRLVCLVVDHNGFGETPFADQTPEYDECSPEGAMRVIEGWLALLGLCDQAEGTGHRVMNFVGHSMGGAALFYLDESRWAPGAYTRTAIAPALLLRDEVGRAFFNALGIGIGLVGRLQFLEAVERLISPHIMEILTSGASQAVKDEHRRIYYNTARSVAARTLAAMGNLKARPLPASWPNMQVFLGHRDVLVSLGPMLDLLHDLNFDVEQVRVLMGTHYLFSVGEEYRRVHAQNRALILDAILALHQRACPAWSRQAHSSHVRS